MPRFNVDLSRPVLCLALDQHSLDENLRLVEQSAGEVDMLKINDDSVDEAGLRACVEPFLQFQLPFWIDMKMWKGSRTMAERAKSAAALGASFINVYALADRLIKGIVAALEGTETGLLGLTVLTHYDDEYCQKFFLRSLKETVLLLTHTSLEHGCDGIILPPTTLSVVADIDTIKANPGIRTHWSDQKANDQESSATPTEAVLGGSKILIVGGPIRNYPDGPAIGARRVKEEMDKAWEYLQSGS